MPGMDKTGPAGFGQNGRGKGPCGGLGYQQGSGLRMRRGFRHGGRFGLRSSQPMSQEDEKKHS